MAIRTCEGDKKDICISSLQLASYMSQKQHTQVNYTAKWHKIVSFSDNIYTIIYVISHIIII